MKRRGFLKALAALVAAPVASVSAIKGMGEPVASKHRVTVLAGFDDKAEWATYNDYTFDGNGHILEIGPDYRKRVETCD